MSRLNLASREVDLGTLRLDLGTLRLELAASGLDFGLSVMKIRLEQLELAFACTTFRFPTMLCVFKLALRLGKCSFALFNGS